MSGRASECREYRDAIIDAIRRAGLDQDAGPLMQVPGHVEAAVDAGCIDDETGEALLAAVRELGGAPTVAEGQPVRKRVRTAFRDAVEDFGDLQPQRDEQTTLDEPDSGRPDRRTVEEGARREDPEQGQTQFGESGGLEGQRDLGGDFAGPRSEGGGDEGARQARGPTERKGVRSLREFVRGDDNGDGNGNGGGDRLPVYLEGHPDDREVSVEGPVPPAILNRYPDERKHDDPEMAFLDDLSQRVHDSLGAVAYSVASGTYAGDVVHEGSGVWRFEPEPTPGTGGQDGADETETITMRDPETGESDTLAVPRRVNGWVYDPDAPGSRGPVVWTPPDDPDRYVAIEKTGGDTWAAVHRDRSDVDPGDPPEDEAFRTSRTAEGALADAKRMMQQRDVDVGGAGGAGNG